MVKILENTLEEIPQKETSIYYILVTNEPFMPYVKVTISMQDALMQITPQTPLRHINNKRNRRRNNVKFVIRNVAGQYQPYAKIKKNIRPGKELFVGYGPTFWQ